MRRLGAWLLTCRGGWACLAKLEPTHIAITTRLQEPPHSTCRIVSMKSLVSGSASFLRPAVNDILHGIFMKVTPVDVYTAFQEQKLL